MRIYVSGSLAYDRIMTFPGKFADHILPEKIHILNVCFMVDNLEEKFGGTAGNISYTLRLLGQDPLTLATAGKDFDRYKAWMVKQGMRLDGVREVEHEFTAGAYITTDKGDNQITGFNPGAMKERCGFDLAKLDPKDSILIISPGCLADMKGYAKECRERGIRYVMDPGQSIPAFSGEELTELLTGAEILVTNDYELELIVKMTGLNKTRIMERCGAVVTTLGEQGCTVAGKAVGNLPVGVPAVAADPVLDPTGAGDAFRAGMLTGLAEGLDLAAACRMGAVAGAYAVEKVGTQEHAFTREEFAARHARAFG